MPNHSPGNLFINLKKLYNECPFAKLTLFKLVIFIFKDILIKNITFAIFKAFVRQSQPESMLCFGNYYFTF